MSNSADSFFAEYEEAYHAKQRETMSLGDYLKRCANDRMAFASPWERLLDAIGKPTIIDTANDKGRLGRIFQSKTIAVYPGFSEFYGYEETIDKVVKHLQGAAAGGEERKQVLYLLGPVGGGKSSLGKKLKELMEQRPIYVLKAKGEKEKGRISPVYESPLALINDPKLKKAALDRFGIEERYFQTVMSPWAVKRLREANGRIDDAFEVVKLWPSEAQKVAIAKVVPGDENNQDISALVGKVDMNALGEGVPQDDTDAYLYSGGFATGNQGIMEFVEMFKAPLKVLNPMLEALQDGTYGGTENIGNIPFGGIVLAHSNESEWKMFSGEKRNEAILDRINLIKVPYVMRRDEELRIYEKMLKGGDYAHKPQAPKTLDTLAELMVMSRLSQAEGVKKYEPNIRVKVYNGEIPEGPSSKIPTIDQLRNEAPSEEGMSGLSPRFGFKTLAATFNANANEGEIAADPILVMKTFEERVNEDDRLNKEDKARYIQYIKDHLMPEYARFIKEEITEAFTGASDEMCQNMFDRYVDMADKWLNNETFNDRGVTGEVLTKDKINSKLEEIEKPAGISNPSSFRDEVVRYVHRQERAGEKVRWDSYQKLAAVIKANLHKQMKDVLPVIKFDVPANDEKIGKKRTEFQQAMEEKGYTLPMIKRAVGVYERNP